MIKIGLKILLTLILILTLTACSGGTPPIAFAPSQEIVKKAIVLSLQQNLSTQLTNPANPFKITQIKIKTLEPLYLIQLPTYHLQGTYNLETKLSDRIVTQKANPFDIYIQRQKEGKTWRWLQPGAPDPQPLWKTYLIQ